MRRTAPVVLLLIAGSLACSAAPAREPVVGGACEGCEAIFDGLPSPIPSVARIAPAGEPGEPMRIEGVVRDERGKPAAGIVVYAYHTDAAGIYPKAGTPHGRLRGWAKTDAEGRYRFDTIRPAPYPEGRWAAHVHMHVLEPGRCTYFIDEILFEDDPLTAGERAKAPGIGGSGIVKPTGDARAGWVVKRDIRLGEQVHGYPVPS